MKISMKGKCYNVLQKLFFLKDDRINISRMLEYLNIKGFNCYEYYLIKQLIKDNVIVKVDEEQKGQKTINYYKISKQKLFNNIIKQSNVFKNDYMIIWCQVDKLHPELLEKDVLNQLKYQYDIK